MLNSGRVEIAFGDSVNTRMLVMKHQLNLRPLKPGMEMTILYPTFHESKSDIQKKLDVEIAAMLEDGSVDAIYNKYLGIKFIDLLPSDKKSDF